MSEGLKAALSDSGKVQPPGTGAEQLALLPLKSKPATVAAEAASKIGRPKGSKNKNTEEWRRFLLAKYRSPLEVLAEAYSRPVGELATQLGCKPLEAFAIQVRAASELAPYVHGKMPVEVAVTGDLPVIQLVMPMVAKIEENQGLASLRPLGVGQSESDGSLIIEHDQGLSDAEPLITDQPGGDAGGAE